MRGVRKVSLQNHAVTGHFVIIKHPTGQSTVSVQKPPSLCLP